MAKLTEEQREFIHMKYLKDVKIKEIAEMSSIPEGTVKTRLYKALKSLRSYFDDKEGKGRSAVFDEEEKKLAKWKEMIDKTDVPQAELELAIKQGFQRAKNAPRVNKRPYVKRGVWSAIVAAVLLITVVTSIRVLPAFANAVASIPGMKKIVAFYPG